MNRILPLAVLAMTLAGGFALAQGTTAPGSSGTGTGTTNATIAATAAPASSSPSTTGSSDYGWIGLFGLVGLAGLIPRRAATAPVYTGSTRP